MQPQQNPNKTDEQPNQPRQANEAEQQRQSNSYSSNSQSQNSESHRSGGHSHNSEQVKEEVKNQNNQAQPNVNPIANSASANQNRQHDRKIRYKYCCKVCKHTDKSKKACVCVVPKNQRRTEIGQQGCQTCGCNGCSKEDFLSRGQDPEYKPGEKKKNRKQKDSIQFEARNGCCRKCMKAFSKSNKSCLCQVPEDVRNTKLPSSGCKICGCFGCNPEDKKDPRHRKTTRKEVSKSRSRQKHRSRRHARSPSQKSSSSQKEKDYIDPSTMNFYNVDKSASAWRNDGERVQNRSCITRIRYSSKNAQLHIRQTQMSSEKKEMRKLIKLLIILFVIFISQ